MHLGLSSTSLSSSMYTSQASNLMRRPSNVQVQSASLKHIVIISLTHPTTLRILSLLPRLETTHRYSGTLPDFSHQVIRLTVPLDISTKIERRKHLVSARNYATRIAITRSTDT